MMSDYKTMSREEFNAKWPEEMPDGFWWFTTPWRGRNEECNVRMARLRGGREWDIWFGLTHVVTTVHDTEHSDVRCDAYAACRAHALQEWEKQQGSELEPLDPVKLAGLEGIQVDLKDAPGIDLSAPLENKVERVAYEPQPNQGWSSELWAASKDMPSGFFSLTSELSLDFVTASGHTLKCCEGDTREGRFWTFLVEGGGHIGCLREGDSLEEAYAVLRHGVLTGGDMGLKVDPQPLAGGDAGFWEFDRHDKALGAFYTHGDDYEWSVDEARVSFKGDPFVDGIKGGLLAKAAVEAHKAAQVGVSLTAYRAEYEEWDEACDCSCHITSPCPKCSNIPVCPVHDCNHFDCDCHKAAQEESEPEAGFWERDTTHPCRYSHDRYVFNGEIRDIFHGEHGSILHHKCEFVGTLEEAQRLVEQDMERRAAADDCCKPTVQDCIKEQQDREYYGMALRDLDEQFPEESPAKAARPWVEFGDFDLGPKVVSQDQGLALGRLMIRSLNHLADRQDADAARIAKLEERVGEEQG